MKAEVKREKENEIEERIGKERKGTESERGVEIFSSDFLKYLRPSL